MIIKLDWPHTDLSPNSHKHWRIKHGAATVAKEIGRIMTLSALARERMQLPDGRIYLSVKFYPPDKRKRDDDNIIASFKHYRDGIAIALGVDDSRFKPTYTVEDCDGQGGRVEVIFQYNSLPFSEVAPIPETSL